MLNSKEDFINCLGKITLPLEKYFTEGKSGIKCGTLGAKHGEKVSLTEAFIRPLWGLAPLWHKGCEIGNFKSLYIEGIKNGTNPYHKEYWGEISDPQNQRVNMDQKIVESCAVALGLILAPQVMWEPLNDTEKQNLCSWLYGINTVTKIGGGNWQFFPIMVNVALKSVGMTYDKAKLKECLKNINNLYVGDGWYTDGIGGNTDYYIPFAIQFYSLIYAKVMEKDDPENSRIFKERAIRFAQDFIYWFAPDGSAIPYGRSLTYRFAECCFWSACVFADVLPFQIGVIKGIVSRHLEWWMSKPIFDNDGILSVGYCYPNLYMSEDYNGFGSPYWALKAFLILALDENHDFYKAEPLPLPKLDDIRIIQKANIVIQRTKDDVIAFVKGGKAPKDGEWILTHKAEKYSKFAYSAKYGFCVPRTYFTLAESGTDCMLVFVKDGISYIRRGNIAEEITDEGKIISTWSPFNGITVNTEITLTKNGHIRKHTINSNTEAMAYDCGFAEEEIKSKITGNGEAFVIKEGMNTNLVNPYTFVNSVRYEIKKGITEIETRIEY